jgi:hypothetical protein
MERHNQIEERRAETKATQARQVRQKDGSQYESLVVRNDSRLRSNGGQSREDGDKSRNYAVCRGASGGPQGRGRSKIFGNNEEAA